MANTSDDWIRNICFLRTAGPGHAGAFDRVLRLCQRTGTELSIVSVVDDPPEGIVRLLASWGDGLSNRDRPLGEGAEGFSQQKRWPTVKAIGMAVRVSESGEGKTTNCSRCLDRFGRTMLLTLSGHAHILQFNGE